MTISERKSENSAENKNITDLGDATSETKGYDFEGKNDQISDRYK